MIKGAPSISQMNRLVSVQAPTETPDGVGGVDVQWAEVVQCWAKMKSLGGWEKWKRGKIDDASKELIVVRYNQYITQKCRVVYEGRVFNIKDIADLEERHFFLELLCEENVAT
jgi:SPP1 family predicted phage head-tail adaptor